MRIRKVRVIAVSSPNDWWFQQGLIGEEFDTVAPTEVKNSVEVRDRFGFKSMIPLAVCIINPHLRLIKGGKQ